MPRVYEKNPECIFCGTHIIQKKKRMVPDKRYQSSSSYDARPPLKSAGEYWSCRCGALTFGSSGFNQRETRK
jgi:hypothetical protein